MFQNTHDQRILFLNWEIQWKDNWSQRRLPIVSQKRVITSKVPRKTRTLAFLIDNWKMNDIECIFRQKISPKKTTKRWDRIASGPERKHVPSGAEREHWKSTYNLKSSKQQQVQQTPWPPSIPNLREAKEWHRGHFRRQGSNTSTQPQTSSSQWQDLEWLARLE